MERWQQQWKHFQCVQLELTCKENELDAVAENNSTTLLSSHRLSTVIKILLPEEDCPSGMTMLFLDNTAPTTNSQPVNWLCEGFYSPTKPPEPACMSPTLPDI